MSDKQQSRSDITPNPNLVQDSAIATTNTTKNQPTNRTPTHQSQQQVETQKVTYIDKTHRLQAWSQLIQSITPFIWVVVILMVIIPLLGRAFIAGSATEKPTDLANKSREEVVIVTPPNSSQLDQAMLTALQSAHHKAEIFASQELDEWVDELMSRVDNSFLDWYFDYFNQKKMEFSAPFVWLSSAVSHKINTNNPPASQAVAEKLTQDFQAEFAKRVLRPRIAQIELERITRDTINVYVNKLGNNIAQIQSRYQIPQGQWERYLDDIAVTIADIEGAISNLSMKVLVGGSSYLLAKAMIPAVTKIGSKVVVSLAGKASAKMAAKTGGAVAGQLGLQFLDPIVAAGILIWDVWDYHHTVQVDRPVLREVILNYLTEVKASLLENHNNSVMSAIYQLEGNITKSLQSTAHVTG
jgi:hypothetical protein